ncbi:MAG: hypothetical protein CME64_08925 [Halobacteriovoraceae bacterium]|nr:hypothetical protein [Halobacteriovoraceae bacterium]
MDQFVTFGMFSGLILLLFLFCREVVMWYFKINKRIELQREILEELRKLNGENGGSSLREVSGQ